jgi:hypothetical protein
MKICYVTSLYYDPTWNGSQTALFYICLFYKQRNLESNSVRQVLLLYEGKHGRSLVSNLITVHVFIVKTAKF